ncbi:DUF4179 domain-containing protein [Lysinibacillus sp. BW-2-10]|uniref:DUF4179 domain-containing protein n=1 Tax=Lysinibacillus sp. BW-2-10 TaxID=2590030 RepID=UPI00118134C0|nr:DUF4179 domain-containing protein [Lysinibacillus sp. BW-2-10]TSI05274.1 DUF4179 domain-containing protein [Lysinibacillus sp. BW-2-10]
MSTFNEKEFAQLHQELQQIEVPKDKINHVRQQAYKTYKQKQRRRKRTIWQVGLVAVLLFAFITSIRVSPVFAQTVAKIPGFAPIVDLLTEDKGEKDIAKNQYYEELNIVQTKNDFTFTLLGTVADESGMIIFYQLEAPYDISELGTKDYRLTQNGKDVEASTGYSWSANNPTNIIQEKIEVVASTKMDYTNPHFELEMTFDDDKRTAFKVPFTLVKPIMPSKYYGVNKAITIENQIIHIESINISPLRAEIKLSTDTDNTMQILQIDDIKVLDEKGEEWGKIKNGIVGFGGFREETASIFIESNYFREPESLTLVLNKVEAMPKGEDYVEIDFLKQQIIKMPELENFELVIRGTNMLDVSYRMPMNHHKQIFSSVYDKNGNKFYNNGTSTTNDEGKIESTYTFDLKDAQNPVRIYFESYPTYLDGTAEIKVPLK